jgi:CHAT domain
MYESDSDFINTKVFRITVNEQGKVEIAQQPEDGKIPDNSIDLEDLQRATIKFLIKMLHEGKLSHEGCLILGAQLYKLLINDKLDTAIRNAINDPQTQLVRVELEFKHSQALRDLPSWPWEYLYCPRDFFIGGQGFFLAKAAKLVLVRHLNLGFNLNRRPTQVEERPVRVLFVAANPDDLPPLMHESVLEVLQQLQTELGEENISLYQLVDRHSSLADSLLEDAHPKATFRQLQEIVDYYKPHVIHLVAHGRYTSGEGSQIALMNENRQPNWIDAQNLGECLASNDQLRLIFLQACESDDEVLPNVYKAISEFARYLASQEGLPAVVGAQYQIGEKYQTQTRAANQFTKTFYSELAHSRPIDAAVKLGWKKMGFELANLPHSHAFGLPVLYCESQALFAPPPAPSQAKPRLIPTCPTVDPEGWYRRERERTMFSQSSGF